MNGRQAIALASAVVVTLAALGVASTTEIDAVGGDDRVQVVATFYPLAYMAEAIGGERVNVHTLIPHNQEVHSWQPSTSDIVAADKADVLLYNGAGLDKWFEDDVLEAIDLEGKEVVETTEGMELIHMDEDQHDADSSLNGDDHDHGGLDPHTWLSPMRAMHQAELIFESLCSTDPDGQDVYALNWDELQAGFDGLILDLSNVMMKRPSRDTIIVTHEAYGYLAHDFGFNQRGAVGISADEQPSARAIMDLVDIMVEEDIEVVFTDPIYSDHYARTLGDELERILGKEVEILDLYMMLGPVDGKDLLQQMDDNVHNIELGLGGSVFGH